MNEGYAQGTWEHIKPEPKKVTGRKDGRGPHDFIEVAAFGRLVKRYSRRDSTIDAMPRETEKKGS